uniref:Uncharacterized protein n=1 Tax=Anguilla anguilla TaxID=7936 RepID=A0A0E9XAX3_ANGAN
MSPRLPGLSKLCSRCVLRTSSPQFPSLPSEQVREALAPPR